ncbi:66_t:CDS:2 [Racocetra fulgida]|uniref:66_t:CDS:1 n=1 Tax=Racocetra fulgida TaxID=60492 RepID=A0A9N9AJI9_9GLOM|nr:66_t:CDS:2 [Racocetra fulgida]
MSKVIPPNNLQFTQYTAPEILAKKSINDKTKLNIYSLGVLFWEVSSNGVEPFQDNYDISLESKIINGRNRNNHDFAITKNDIFKNVEVKTDKTDFIPIVFLVKINTSHWEVLNNLSPCSNGGHLFADADKIQIHIPVGTIEYCGNLNADFIQEIKDALNISNVDEKKNKLKEIFHDYGNYVITKFTIGGTITIDCSKADPKSLECLQTYLSWGISYAKGESLPIFELTSLDSFPSFETLPSRAQPMKCVGDLYSWLKDLHDYKNVTIISYEGYKPSFGLLDEQLQNGIFECFSFKPNNQSLPKLIPQLPATYEQKSFSEWVSKPSLLSHAHDLIENNLSLQYNIFPKHYSKLGYGKSIRFKFLKQPKIISTKKITISFIYPKNQHITHLSYDIDKLNLDETFYHITPIDDVKCSTQIFCQITYHAAEISWDSPSMIPAELYKDSPKAIKAIENYYGNTLPKALTIGSTLTTYEACNISNLPYKFPQETSPEKIEQILEELNIDTSFISNNGNVINRNQIKDWSEAFNTNPENWKIISFGDWSPCYKTLHQFREDIKFVSNNEYQIVFHGENSFSHEDQNIIIKFPHPLINDNYQIFGNILKKYPNNLGESWKKIPEATIAFNITKIEWFVLAKSGEYCADNSRDIKATCGKIDIDVSQSEIFIRTDDINTNCTLVTSFVHKPQSDTTRYYNITLSYWTKYEIVLKIRRERQNIFEEFEISNENNKIKDGSKPDPQEKITLNWYCDDLIDNEPNYLSSLNTTKQNLWSIKHNNFNSGSFLCLDKNSKGNEWIIKLAIKTENESLANRDRAKDIKARNAYALKIPLNVPTLNSYLPELYKLPVTFQFPLPLIEIENDVQLIQEWSLALEKMNHNIITQLNESQATEEFKIYITKFVADAF